MKFIGAHLAYAVERQIFTYGISNANNTLYLRFDIILIWAINECFYVSLLFRYFIVAAIIIVKYDNAVNGNMNWRLAFAICQKCVNANAYSASNQHMISLHESVSSL